MNSSGNEGLSRLEEGITLVLSRWTALQTAVENQWGGKNSRLKSQTLASTILSWFAQTKGELYIDDLENMLDENMLESFNIEIEDGSIEEVAEQLMIMHEDCLKGNFESIEKLKKLGPGKNSVSKGKQVVVDSSDENSDESSDDEVSDMMVDEPKPEEMSGDKPNSKDVPDEEGWSVVAPRRKRGQR